VKKIPYSIDAANTPVRYHDETATAFCLSRFQTSRGCARRICQQDGLSDRRLEGIHKAIECNNVASCEYSSWAASQRVNSLEVVTDEKDSHLFADDRKDCARVQGRKNCPDTGIDYPQGRIRVADRQMEETGSPKAKKASSNSKAAFYRGRKIDKILRRDGNCCLSLSRIAVRNTATAFCSIPIGEHTTWPCGERFCFRILRTSGDKRCYSSAALHRCTLNRALHSGHRCSASARKESLTAAGWNHR